MPIQRSSRYSFILTIDGSQAIGTAKKVAPQLQAILGNAIDAKKVKKAATDAGKGIERALVDASKRGRASMRELLADMYNIRSQDLTFKGLEKNKPLLKEVRQRLDELATASAKATKAVRAAGGESIASWQQMSKAERFFRSMAEQYSETWGIRRGGYAIQQYGRGAMMLGGASIAAGALAMREYIKSMEPLEAASRNLELTAEMQEYLKDQIIGTGDAVQLYLRPEEYADMLYLWAAATGATAESQADLNEILKETESVQLLAKLGRLDYGQAVETVTDIQSQFHMSVEDTNDIVATLIKVAATSKAEVGDLGEAFSFAGARAEAFNIPFEEVAATLELVSSAGIRGTRAGRGLARLLENLTAPSKEAKKIMDEAFGEDAFFTMEGNFIGLSAAIDLMASSMKDMTQEQQNYIISAITTENAARVLQPLINLQTEAQERNINVIDAQIKANAGLQDSSVEAFQTMMEQVFGYTVSIESAQETMDRFVEHYENSVTGKVADFQITWDRMVQSMGEAVATIGLPALKGLANEMERVTGFIQENAWAAQGLMVASGLVIGVGALVTLLGKGIVLYADVKMISTAAIRMASADKEVAAAVGFATSVKEFLAGIGIFKTSVDEWLAGQVAGGGKGAMFASGVGFGGTGTALAKLLSVHGLVAIVSAVLASIGEGRRLLGPREQLEPYGQEAKGAIIYDERTPFVVNQVKGEIQVAATGERATMEDFDAYLEEIGLLELAADECADSVSTSLRTMIDELDELGLAGVLGFGPLTLGFQGVGETADWLITPVDILTAKFGDATYSLMGMVSITQQQAQFLEDLAGALGMTASQFGVFTNMVNGATYAAEEFTQGPIATAIAMMQEFYSMQVPETERAMMIPGRTKSAMGMFGGLYGEGLIGKGTVHKWGVEYLEELEGILEGANEMERWELELALAEFDSGWRNRVDTVKTSAAEIERIHKDSLKKMEQAEKDYRKFVEGLLTPTEVTAEDVFLTSVGDYKPKWDEYVRQLRAAQAGSPEWKHLLPPELEMGMDQEATNRWVDEEIAAFMRGERLGKVDWGAFVASYDAALAQEAGKERLVDEAIKQLQLAGRNINDPMVRRMLGLESPIETMLFAGKSPEDVGADIDTALTTAFQSVTTDETSLENISAAIVASLSAGVEEELTSFNIVTLLVASWTTQFEDGKEDIISTGKIFGGYFFAGILESVDGSAIVTAIEDSVLTTVAEWLEEAT